MTTAFFLPDIEGQAGTVEKRYAALAAICMRAVPPMAERVHSIDFISGVEHWTATVGQRLSGKRTDRRRRQGKTVDVTTPLTSPATVLAIFPGHPYMVATDQRLTAVTTGWANPFMAGEPDAVRYFDA